MVFAKGTKRIFFVSLEKKLKVFYTYTLRHFYTMFRNCPGAQREVGAMDIRIREVREEAQDKVLKVSTSFCLALILSCPL